MTRSILLLAFLACSFIAQAQSISSEKVEIQTLQAPAFTLPEAERNYAVKVSSPYNLTTNDIIKQAKKKHEEAIKNYDNKLKESEKEYEQVLKNYKNDVKKANEQFATESAAFKKLSLLERMSMTDQGKNPQLKIQQNPNYVKPAPPEYKEPNMADYIVVDNQVLASQIIIEGLSRGKNDVDVTLNLEQAHFQDNAGQTYINQPTKLVVSLKGKEVVNKSFFTEYEFLSSSPTTNINQPQEEKNYLAKVMQAGYKYLTEQFGYKVVKTLVELEAVKNKGKHDDLEKADIYIKTNLRKLQPVSNAEDNAPAFAGLQKGVDLWVEALKKVDYKNSKADYNARIAKYIYLNLVRLHVALGDKKQALQYLLQLQENLVDINLNSDEQKELVALEKIIYKKN